MAESSANYHEPYEVLDEATREHHRAIVSLMEELEAIDWYRQRIDASTDPELVEILTHNRDDEKEHAAMTLEWLRRRDPELDAELRTYLYTDGPIAGRSGEGSEEGPTDGSLGIGSLKS